MTTLNRQVPPTETSPNRHLDGNRPGAPGPAPHEGVRQPGALMRGAAGVGRELARIGLGKSQVAPDKADKCSADPAWRGNPFFRAVMQTYLYLGSGVDNLSVEGVNAERARFALSLLREALAPTNFFLTNPAALKRCIETGGGSVRKGIANWAGDVLHNHGMPSMVDRRPFKIGENIAATPGAVIHRTEVFELIQYTPHSDTVYQRPLLVVPPQVNKYYALDLAPGRSMYEYLLKQGIQVFGISWRNPSGARRDWDFDTYAQATIEAIDVCREVTGSPDVNIMGGCLGGMTVAVVQSHLAASGDHRINSATMAITLLDCESDGRMFLLATPQSLGPAKRASLRKGVIDGWQMAQVFAWLRPNDLVWNYWVNNYLLGQDPPAFDILAWNADTTRLTSAFHSQLIDMVAGNQLVRPGAMKVLGTPIDISRITCDTYVVAGRTDHITPWHTCYRTTQLVSGRSQFVLCSSGHIQTVVADPKHPRLGYFVNPETPPEAEQWLAGAQRHEGSWWENWASWLADRSGEQGRSTPVRRQSPLPGERAGTGHLRTSMTIASDIGGAMNDTQDRVALVTGGTRGIGAAISTRLAQTGARVAAVYNRNTQAAESFAKTASNDGLAVSLYQADVGNPGDCQRVVNEVLRDHGRIDYLINNAGAVHDRTALKMSVLDWEQVIRVNLSGPFFMSKAVLGHFLERGSGRIVNVSSFVGQTGRIGQANYSAAKAGLFGLTKTLALETATKGITVNCVLPGAIETDMVSALPEEIVQAVIETIPMRALGTPEDVAEAVRYLVSDEAHYATGALLPVTGGLLMM